MIILEFANRIIIETLTNRLAVDENDVEPIGKEHLDIQFADFDGIKYHLTAPSDSLSITLSIWIKCWKELEAAGCRTVLEKDYGDFIVSNTEGGYSLTLNIDFTAIPKDKHEPIISKLSMLKRNCFAAPFLAAFEAQAAHSSLPPIAIPYRPKESIYVHALNDRVTVTFSIAFQDPSDVVYGKVFLQEFADARKTTGLQNAPQVLFSKDLPMELTSVGSKSPMGKDDSVGYVTFVLFPRHFSTDAKKENMISLVPTFRDYLFYHVKCTKAYMHTRMRAKVSEFLKILNRAKPDMPTATTERKTATGKTFVRK